MIERGQTDWTVRSIIARNQIWLVFALIAWLLGFSKELLDGVHWDVPIYLYHAKRFAETHYLHDFARNAWEISAHAGGGWPADEAFSEAFWRSTRLGHITLLGFIVQLFGSTLVAISVASWIFVFFLFALLCLSAMIAGKAAKIIEPDLDLSLGIGISVLLCLVSEIYSYLTGNLVSEVSSLMLTSASILILLRGLRENSAAFAILSALLIFLSYTIRVESVWPWLSFILVYFIRICCGQSKHAGRRLILISGSTALAAYLVYAYLLYPLPDPRLYVAFASSLTERARGGASSWPLLGVAGGAMWIGALLALRWILVSPYIQFGWIWLALTCLPSLILVALKSEIQTRMLVACIAPLLWLSAAGWSKLLRCSSSRGLVRGGIVLTLVYVVLSRPFVYHWLTQQPGLWRVQDLRSALFVPKYERVNYFPAETEELSSAIYGDGRRATLISDPSIRQEVLNMIRFFGPSYPEYISLAMVGDPTNSLGCEEKREIDYEPVRFCRGFLDETAFRVAISRQRVLYLRGVSDRAPIGTHELIRTSHFAIDEWQ